MKSFLVLLLFIFSVSALAKFSTYEEFALSTFRQYDNTLTIHVIPAPDRLEWTKPRWLLWSLLKNDYWFPKTTSSLGHVTGEINCNLNGEKVHNFIGQTSPDLDGFRTYVHMGYGFSILNSPNQYKDLPLLTTVGLLDDYKKATERYARLVNKDHMGFLSFKISEEACQNINDFMTEYQTKTKETKLAGNRYGFGADPFKFEGAGCAPMVQSLLLKGGIDDYARFMEQTVYVSDKLLGDPPNGKKVGVLDLLFSDEDISVEKKEARVFRFPDPQGLYDRIMGIVHSKFVDDYPVLEKKNLNDKNVWYVLLDTTQQ